MGLPVVLPLSFLARQEKMFDWRRRIVDKFSRRCYKSNIHAKSNGWSMVMFESVYLDSYTSDIASMEKEELERSRHGYRSQ